MDTATALLFDQANYILTKQLGQMGYSPEQIKSSIGYMKDNYELAEAIENDKDATAAQKKLAKTICASITKAVPDMTKAVISAVAAFNRKAPITGSAAVMDICASVAPVLGSLASISAVVGAAGGPIGMLVGALFSMVAQILMIFAEKTESMIDQIEAILNRLDQEQELQNIKSVHDDILVYAQSLRSGAAKLIVPLYKSVKNSDEAEVLQKAIGTLATIVSDNKPAGTVMHNFWNVMEWLEREDRQDLDKWPEVLGVWCKSYIDLVTSTMTIALFGNSSWAKNRLKEVEDHLTTDHGLSKEKFRTARQALVDLEILANARKLEYEACNSQALEFLNKITSVARNRGLFFIINTYGNLVHVGTGQQVITRNQWQTIFNYTRGMSITVDSEDSGKLDPQYNFFNLAVIHDRPGERVYDDMYHATLDYRKSANPSGSAVIKSAFIRGTASEFSDLCCLPDPDPRAKNSFYVYLADAPEHRGLQLHKLDENNELKRVGWSPPTKSPLSHFRVVAVHSVLSDDPDKDAMPDQIKNSTGQPSHICYGALSSSLEIYIDRTNERCYVAAPWNYSGIAVDPYFLWVFSPDRFTCATHASVMKCIKNRGATPPRWLTAPSLSHFSAGEKLVDLCPCDDGTLFISSTSTLYTAAFRNDVSAGKITVDEPWTQFAHRGYSSRVHKLPIPCWKVFDSLKVDLQAHSRIGPAI